MRSELRLSFNGVHKWSFIVSVVLVVLSFATASLADAGTITLKSGEVLEVEVLDLEFGRLVNVKFEDGTVKTIEWEEIADLKMSRVEAEKTAPGEERVVLEETDPGAQPEAPAAAEPVPPRQQPIVKEPEPKSTGPTKYELLQIVERDIDDLKENMPGIGGGITLTAIGLGGGVAFLALAAATAETCNVCDVTPQVMIGVTGITMGIIGMVVLSTQSKKREPYQEKISRLEREREHLKADIRAGRTGAVGTLTYSF